MVGSYFPYVAPVSPFSAGDLPTRVKDSPVYDEVAAKEYRDAAKKLWSAVLSLRRNTPTGFGAMDFYTEVEYGEGLRREAPLLSQITFGVVNKWLELDNLAIEEERLVLGEDIWRAFAAYRGLLGRACMMTASLRVFAGNRTPWYKDADCRGKLSDAVGDDGARTIDSLSIGKLNETHSLFASRINELLRKSRHF